jgi:FtsH-binding integral membrane protein
MEESKKVISRQDKMLGWFLCIFAPLMAVLSLAMKFNGDKPVSTLSCVLLVAISSTMFVAGLLCLTRPSLFAMILGGISFFAYPITAAVAEGKLDEMGSEFASMVIPACISIVIGAVISPVIVPLVRRFRKRNNSPPDAAAESTDPPPPEDLQ